MIKPVELYHGAVLVRLAQYKATKNITLHSYPTPSRCSYVIDDQIGIYIKHSAARMTPWSFNFTKAHQDEIQDMTEKLERIFITLVCGKDGIACLSYQELKGVLNYEHAQNEWVKASRFLREKYRITGSDGKLKHKIADSHFPRRLFE